jgi:hypothetical protein
MDIFKVGDIVRHKACPEYGIGKIVHIFSDGNLYIIWTPLITTVWACRTHSPIAVELAATQYYKG